MSDTRQSIKVTPQVKEHLDKLKADLRVSNYSKLMLILLKAMNEHQTIAHQQKAKYVDATVFLEGDTNDVG